MASTRSQADPAQIVETANFGRLGQRKEKHSHISPRDLRPPINNAVQYLLHLLLQLFSWKKNINMEELQILSDLHLEAPSAYDIFDIPRSAPNLALLGDVGNVRDKGFFPFVQAQLCKFRTVFLLLGNHEPYHSSWEVIRQQIRQFAENSNSRPATDGFGKFVFLDQTRYDLSNNVTILGCTLHSKIPAEHEERVSFGLNDFYHIDNWSVEKHNAVHTKELAWLNEQVSSISTLEPERKIVIFTHHSPITRDSRAVDPAHVGSPISTGFSTDLSGEECWKNPSVCMWAFGHTHFNCDYTLDNGVKGKRIFSNQRGYYFKQAEDFKLDSVVTI